MTRIILVALTFFAIIPTAEARHNKAYLAHPDCNVQWPCEGVAPSPRGERIVKAMGGFGSAQKVYIPRIAKADYKHVFREKKKAYPIPMVKVANVVAHPSGCPTRAFCGCGAVERLKQAWGVIVSKPRELWLAANWFKFPRSAPAPGTVAVRQHHVFVLEAHLGGDTWQVYDANSGGHQTRIHARSIAGYTIVNPRGAA